MDRKSNWVPVLGSLLVAAVLVSGCVNRMWESAQVSHCKEALDVTTKIDKKKKSADVENALTSQRPFGGSPATTITLTYTLGGTRSLMTCFYRGKSTKAVGYVYRGIHFPQGDVNTINKEVAK
jgi:hypothetical protein